VFLLVEIRIAIQGMRRYFKSTKIQKRRGKGAGNMAQVAEHLPSMYKIMDSIPSITKKFSKKSLVLSRFPVTF
jgi:hypothetical protein